MKINNKKISFYKIFDKSLSSNKQEIGYFDFFPNQLEMNRINSLEYKKYVISIWFFIYSFNYNLNSKWDIELFKKYMNNFFTNYYNFNVGETEILLNILIKNKLFIVYKNTIFFDNKNPSIKKMFNQKFYNIEYNEVNLFIKNIDNILTSYNNEFLKYNWYFYNHLQQKINLSICNESFSLYQDFFKELGLNYNYSKYIFLTKKIFDVAKIDINCKSYIESIYKNELSNIRRKFFKQNTSHMYLIYSQLMRKIKEFKSNLSAQYYQNLWIKLFKKYKEKNEKMNMIFDHQLMKYL